MAKTTIAWTDYSWPVINGCHRVSLGCSQCYAERLTATRLRHVPRYQGLAEWRNGYPHWTGESRLDRDELYKPFRWKRHRRVFVCQMGDLFYERNTDEQIVEVFGVMAACQQHQFQVLTKRPERALDVLTTTQFAAQEIDFADNLVWDKLTWVWPLPNVHMLTSVEHQATLEPRMKALVRLPAVMRGLSVEPMLGPVDLEAVSPPMLDLLGWIIIGCESGPGRRPCRIEWVKALVEQCRRHRIPCFVKQLDLDGRVSHDPAEWPKWARVREMPRPIEGRWNR